MPNPFDLLAEQKANQYGVDPAVVKAVIRQESSGNPLAVSVPTRYGHARGLMQLIPATGARFGLKTPEDFFDPEKNIDAGTQLIAELSKRYAGQPDQLSKVFAAYNTGPGNVPVDQPFSTFFPRLPAETRNYVTKLNASLSKPAVSALSAHAVAPPTRQASLRTAQDPRLLESLYNYVFGQENAGLPPAKTWPGPELGLPPDQLSTGDLASMGLLALSGMGAAAPSLGGALPGVLVAPMTMRGFGDLAMGYVGGEMGERVGESLGGDVGHNIGRGVGSIVSFPVGKRPVTTSDLQKKAWYTRTKLRTLLNPEEQKAFDGIDWDNSRWLERSQDVLGPAIARDPTIAVAADSMQNALLQAKRIAALISGRNQQGGQAQAKLAWLRQRKREARP